MDAGAVPGTLLDEDLMPAIGQLTDTDRGDRHAMLFGLYLAGNTDDQLSALLRVSDRGSGYTPGTGAASLHRQVDSRADRALQAGANPGRGLDQAEKQGVRPVGARAELGVGLGADEEGMIDHFDVLDEVVVG